MTPSRYYFARLARSFGVRRRHRRMAEAASEMHLLREAEQVLGQALWENTENLEALGVEYWNIRKLYKERDELLAQLDACETSLADAHQQRAGMLDAKTGPEQEMETHRASIITELEELARNRDTVVQQAREIRRIYDGLKMKYEVLQKDGDPGEVAKVKSRMDELKQSFTDLKRERDDIADRLVKGDAELNELDSKLSTERLKHRSEASEAFQQIGQTNRDISTLKSKLGVIDGQLRQLYSEIGRHISRHAPQDPACRAVAKGQMPLINVMSALRQSITLNHQLAEM